MLLNFDYKKFFLILLAILLPLLSINMEQQPGQNPWIARPLSYIVSATESVLYQFTKGVKDTTVQYLQLIGIKKQIRDLIAENKHMQAKLQMLTELELENDRLRGLLGFQNSTKMQMVPAQVIGRDLITDHDTITINKGSQDGLKPGQAVITREGALGYIFRPQPFSSHVMLLTDRYAVADGILQRTRARGLVEGTQDGLCQLKYLEKTEDVQTGDRVVTGNLDRVFPKGLPIGTVERVDHRDYEVTLKIILQPVVDKNKVEEVFVITNTADANFENAEELLK